MSQRVLASHLHQLQGQCQQPRPSVACVKWLILRSIQGACPAILAGGCEQTCLFLDICGEFSVIHCVSYTMKKNKEAKKGVM